MDEARCVAFRDRVVEVGTGKWVPRDDNWFDGEVLSVDWDEEATCPVWDRCLDEWSGGDPEWKELMSRMMGYAMVGSREFQRWFLLWGKTRSGKGTSQWVLSRLLGEGGVHSVNVRQLGSQYGLWGAETAKVISVAEFAELDTREGHDAAAVIKNAVGQDAVRVDRKYLGPVRVVLPGVVIVQSNEVPNLPNKGQGLSDKMCVIPFMGTWLNKEDVGLKEKLAAELGGIAMWAFRGAERLFREKEPGLRWPMPKASREHAAAIRETLNPMEAFLEARFTKAPGGFVTSRRAQELWLGWCEETGLPGRHGGPLGRRMVEEGGWALKCGKAGKDGTRVVWGLLERNEGE